MEGLGGLALPILFLVVLYMLLIRPQQKRQKEHRNLVSDLQVGDNVITIGGIHGQVVALGEDTMDLRVTGDDDLLIRFQRTSTARVIRDDAGA